MGESSLLVFTIISAPQLAAVGVLKMKDDLPTSLKVMQYLFKKVSQQLMHLQNLLKCALLSRRRTTKEKYKQASVAFFHNYYRGMTR